MTTFPGSPRLLKGGIVLIDPATGAVQRVITLQYNPATLQRSLTARTVAEAGNDRSQALRLTGPPQETYTLEAEIDAADQLEKPAEHQAVVEHGIAPQLAALESILYPPSGRLISNHALAAAGVLEIAPVEQPLMLFVWSRNRVMPVRLTSYSVTEEAFDPRLNPLRAKVSLGFRVLTVDDLGFDHRGGNIYLAYHQQVERLATRAAGGALGDLGLTGIP
ncbi:MAG TPA: hypothetical protein VGX50_17120 [Longimicrobium sp.]|jgi:hypothetical protein|nr:hypothetical protein [Longimicrobium sp.]